MARPKLPAAHAPPPGSPDDTEQQFYDALRQGDIDKLMAVWADDDDISCVHPGGSRVIGPREVRSAFEAIFANGAINVHPDKVRRLHTHACAVHSVLEQVHVMTGDGPKSAWIIATNVYVQTAEGWRLVAHHASPGTPREAHEVAEAAALLH